MTTRRYPWLGETKQVVSETAATVSGDSGTLAGYGPMQTIRAQLDVTAASGTSPTLDVVVEDTLDGTNWNEVGAFAQKVATGREVINISGPFSDRLRVVWTISGTTPSLDFAVDWTTET